MSSTDDRKLRADKRDRHDGKITGDTVGPVRHLVANGQPTGEITLHGEKQYYAAESARPPSPRKTREEIFEMIEIRLQREAETICRKAGNLSDDEIAKLDKISTTFARHARADREMTADEYAQHLREKQNAQTPE